MTIEGLRHARELIDAHIAVAESGGTIKLLGRPAWMSVAEGKLGEHEVRGARANPFILVCHASTTLGRAFALSDETPWCSSFVNWCITGAGIEGTNSARARSWLGWGEVVDDSPELGDVVILRRGRAGHHVGFYTGHKGPRLISVLGGNQSDEVSYKDYSTSKVLGYRRPEAE